MNVHSQINWRGAAVAGRPRILSNADLLAAASRVLVRVGPARLTLADVAAEAGLAPPTLVQRFGSKRGMLLAYAEYVVGTVPPHFRVARTEHASPLAALFGALGRVTEGMATPEALANSLSMLQLDLTDPDFNRHARRYLDTAQAEIRALLDEAVAAGELAPCDTDRLARAVHTAYNGSLVFWAIHQEGSLDAWVRGDLEVVLTPYRARLT